MYVCVDIDPLSRKILGSTVQKKMIESDYSILIESPIFSEHGVEGLVVDKEDRRHPKNMVPITRVDGDIWTTDGSMPLISAAYALINPKRNLITYTMSR